MYSSDNQYQTRNIILTIVIALGVLIAAYAFINNRAYNMVPAPDAAAVQAVHDDPNRVTNDSTASGVSDTIHEQPVTSDDISTIEVDGKNVGVLLDNGAVAITNGRVLFGHDAPYSDAEVATLQSTPVTYTVTIRNNGSAVAFGYKIGEYDKGVIMHVTTTEVTILDGELVIWPSYDMMVADVKSRIPDEVQNGNADFNSLAFHWISQELRGFVADKLITDRGVQIIP